LSFRMPPATCPEIAFWVRRRWAGDCGAGGNSLGGCVDCRYVSPLSGVFQATHVKPENRPSGLENDAIKAVSGAALVAPALFIWKCCNLQEWLDKLGRYGPRTLSCRSVQVAPI
jgi:hypothetical protein